MSNILYLERVEWELVTRSKSLYFSRDFPPGLHVFVHVPFLLLSLSISIHLIVALARDRNKQFTHPQKDTAASLPLFSGPLVLAHRYLYQISEQVCLYLTLPDALNPIQTAQSKILLWTFLRQNLSLVLFLHHSQSLRAWQIWSFWRRRCRP